MKTFFDLEQDIMQVWNLKEDLELVYAGVCDNSLIENKELLENALLGLITLHAMRCDKAFLTFEEVRKDMFEKNVELLNERQERQTAELRIRALEQQIADMKNMGIPF